MKEKGDEGRVGKMPNAIHQEKLKERVAHLAHWCADLESPMFGSDRSLGGILEGIHERRRSQWAVKTIAFEGDDHGHRIKNSTDEIF